MQFMYFIKRLLVLSIVAALAAGGAFYYWAHTPLQLGKPTLDVTIKPYSSVRSVATQLRSGGVPVDAPSMHASARSPEMVSQTRRQRPAMVKTETASD